MPPRIEVVKKEIATVDFGTRGDPQRIAKIVGEIPHWLDPALDPGCFEPAESDPKPWCWRAGIDAWPEGKVDEEIVVLKFNPRSLRYDVLKTLIDEFTDYKHLLFPWLTIIPRWADELRNAGLRWIAATNPDSPYRHSNNMLDVPAISCRWPPYTLFTGWLDWSWYRPAAVLVACKS